MRSVGLVCRTSIRQGTITTGLFAKRACLILQRFWNTDYKTGIIYLFIYSLFKDAFLVTQTIASKERIRLIGKNAEEAVTVKLKELS
jgi:hypothetical protein